MGQDSFINTIKHSQRRDPGEGTVGLEYDVAVCCSVLQAVACNCSVPRQENAYTNGHTAGLDDNVVVRCSAVQCVAVRHSVLQGVAVCCGALQCTLVRCGAR